MAIDLSVRDSEDARAAWRQIRQMRTTGGRLAIRDATPVANPEPDPPEAPGEVADPEDDADDKSLAAPTSPFGIDGYACVTGEPYEMADWLGPYTEIVDPGAFAATLGMKADVRLLLNHAGIPLARTKSGTLQLDEDGTGLHAVAPELDALSSLALDIYSAMKRGDLDEMSFMFRIVRAQWSPDYMQFNIQEVELFDVSIVTFPANPATSVDLCSIDLMAAPEADARAAFETLSRRFAPTASGLVVPAAPAVRSATPRRDIRERILATL